MIDQLQKIAEEHGGRCLSDSCRDDNTIIRMECAKKHRWEVAADHIRLQGKWCPICARSTKRTIEDMQALAAERCGKCLSVIYKGAHSKLWWECSEGHQWEALPSSIANGSWCPVCAGNARYTIEDLQNVAAERGGHCRSAIYKNGMTRLLWECSEGHHWEALPMKVLKGTWCPTCYNKTRGGFNRLSIEEMHQLASSRDGRCLSEAYTNNRTKLLWECGEGHQWEATPASVKKGTWCPECYISPLTIAKQERTA